MQTQLPDMQTQISDRRGTGGAVTASSGPLRRQGQLGTAAPVSIEKRQTISIEKGKKRTVGEEIEACTSEDPDSNDRFWFQSPDIPVDPKIRDEMLAKYEKDTRAALISANKRRDEDDKVCSRFRSCACCSIHGNPPVTATSTGAGGATHGTPEVDITAEAAAA